MIASIKNTENSQIIVWHLKLLETQEQAKPKTSGRTEIIRAKLVKQRQKKI
jgi:hypothetical protein